MTTPEPPAGRHNCPGCDQPGQDEVLADLIARCPEHGTSTEAWPECRCAAARVAAELLARTVGPVDFATVEYPDGTTWTRLDRLTDGRVMCCLCFEYVTRDRLAPDEEHEGCVTDVCLPCALREAREVARRAETTLGRVWQLLPMHPGNDRWTKPISAAALRAALDDTDSADATGGQK